MKTLGLKLVNTSNGSPLCPIYLFTPFSALLDVLLFGLFLLFYSCILLVTLCPISTFPPRTNHLSDATSSVKLYLSHASTHVDEI